MPLWTWCYFILVIGLACRDTQLRLREGDSMRFIAGGASSSLCSLAAIWAFWHPGVATFMGRALFVTTLYALVWDCMTMKHDIRADVPAPQLSPLQNRVAVWVTTVVAFAMMLPAYYFGFVAAYEHLPRATQRSNQAMQRTATRCAITFSMIKTLPLRLALAPGSRR
jgi:hypothetical protein